MCGRFTLTASSHTQLALEFSVDHVPEIHYQPRYNVAPSQSILAVIQNENQRRMGYLRWGLVPSWAKDQAIGYKMINARSETVKEKPSFRQAFLYRRCLVLADGFFEWDRSTTPRQPYYFQLSSRKPFAFAGLWETWKPSADEPPLHTCTILTTNANDVVAAVHERMPVILDHQHAAMWLNDYDSSVLQSLFEPFDSEAMVSYPVSTIVNSPKNDIPECIEVHPPPEASDRPS